ncbi:MAG: ArsA family ATPase [Clostridiales bacterium]|nr:ArsA family ATPase [Clostridiales bacterium]
MSENCYSLNKLDKLKLMIFSGKGGVGKTTCAGAAAMYFAEQGKRTLLASTDPAHSLLDSLELNISQKGEPVKESHNLYVLEMDASRELKSFKKNYGEILQDIIDLGTYLDREDTKKFFELSLPGLDELMAIIALTDLLDKYDYDLIVVDTAPTGHTLRLFEMPDQMIEWLQVLDLMLEKHRYMASLFGRYVPGPPDQFIQSKSEEILNFKSLLSDPQKTCFFPVVTPEQMSINETKRLIGALQREGLTISEIIVNKVLMGQDYCEFCSSWKNHQIAMLAKIEQKFPDLKQICLPFFPQEVKGKAALLSLADYIFSPKHQNQEYKREILAVTSARNPSLPTVKSTPRIGPEIAEKKFFLIGGKGGTGKTTISSATGLYLSSKGFRTLIFSTDPAHSLADSFGCRIGNKITPLPGGKNLFGFEISPHRALAAIKEQYTEEIDAAFESVFGNTGFEIRFDREVMEKLITLAPPGLDEIMAIMKLLEPEIKSEFDAVVLDTAPTGHMLRFLELPELAREWLGVFFDLLMKYSGVVKMQKTAELLVEYTAKIRQLQTSFTDPSLTTFIGVTLPKQMVIAETKRLLDGVKRLGINSQWLVVNSVFQSDDCSFCRQIRAEEKQYVEKIRMQFSGYHTVEVPFSPRELKGDELKNLIPHLWQEGGGEK